MKIEIPNHQLLLSVIGGPEDDPVNFSWTVRVMERVRSRLAKGNPSMRVHGDGASTWEVASCDPVTMKPKPVPEFQKWFMPPPMSTDRYCIYGNVPTNFLVGWIVLHAGDTAARPLIQRALAAGFEG